MRECRTLLIGLTIALAFFAPLDMSRATGPATTPAADDQQQMELWWTNLAKNEPWATRAVLDFSSRPAQSVAFFKEHLKPLKLEQAELDDALRDLDSDDEKVWKPAFEKLEYLDPRLCEGLQKLMADATDQVGRNRLVAVLCDVSADAYKGQNVMLSSIGGADFNFEAGDRSWWAESKVSRLDSDTGWGRKKQWMRADRAIVILQCIGTPEALSILKDLATGNPQAQPTKVAKVAVESLDTTAK